MKPQVLVALSTFAEYGQEPLKLLKKSGFSFTLNSTGKRLTSTQILDLGRNCAGIIAGVEIYDATVLSQLSQLRCLSRCGVGVDNIDASWCSRKGIKIFNTPEVVVQPVAEMTIGMIFDVLRRLSLHTTWMKRREWKKEGGSLLKGKPIGIVGLGRIGRKVAEMLVKLEAKVSGFDPKADLTWARKNGVTMLTLPQLLKSSQVISLHVADDPQRPWKLSRAQLSRLPKGAYVINVSRGHQIDEDALVELLNNGHLAGAALDVFPSEPYSGKLTDCANVVLTPHIATLTAESRLEMEIQATQNLLRYLRTLS